MVLHIWAWSTSGLSAAPTIVEFNYAPPNMSINIGGIHHNLFYADQGDSMQFDLDVSSGQDANLFVWDPMSFGSPTWQSTSIGDDTLAFVATFSGQYVQSVYGETTADYTLNVIRNGVAGQRNVVSDNGRVNNPNAYVPNRRPTFVAPIPQKPLEYSIFLPVVIRGQ